MPMVVEVTDRPRRWPSLTAISGALTWWIFRRTTALLSQWSRLTSTCCQLTTLLLTTQVHVWVTVAWPVSPRSSAGQTAILDRLLFTRRRPSSTTVSYLKMFREPVSCNGRLLYHLTALQYYNDQRYETVYYFFISVHSKTVKTFLCAFCFKCFVWGCSFIV